MDTNTLYYGDNLKILREYIPDDSVDLIYLDPPFNSNATYNVLFKEPTGKPSNAQMNAFEDTWQWGLESERALQEIAASPIAPTAMKEFMSVLPNFVGSKTPMRAYLTMMAVRLLELRRVLKDTGSLYLHCDPTASHYLKLLMDTIFVGANFKNEIIWKRINAKSNVKRKFGAIHDVILVYTQSLGSELWNQLYRPLDLEYVNTTYRYIEQETGRRYSLADLTASMQRASSGQIYEWKGKTPPASRCWVYAKEKMEELEKNGRIVYSSKGYPRFKSYLDENPGEKIPDLWDDIPIVSGRETLGYPTQKPEALLERIINASSNEGDTVLDPFCGCGTAIVVAEKLKRQWIGIDITTLAIGLMEWRLKNIVPFPSFKVVGEPEDLTGAIDLAGRDKYQFQWWAAKKIGGQPYADKKKGADTGIDGYIYYMDEKDKIKKAIVSVKSGGVHVDMIRDLGHVIEREKSEIGVFITLERPTRPMLEEAAMKGFYRSPLGRDYPRLQILTVEDILGGKTPDIPPWIAPITAPSQTKKTQSKTTRLL